MKLLAIKIGNTNIGFGVFENRQLLLNWRVQTRIASTADQYASLLLGLLQASQLTDLQFYGGVIGSVVPPLTPTFEELCRRYLHFDPFTVMPGAKSGMQLRYQDPRMLGADRLAAAVAARAAYGYPALVIDFGTATTFNALDSQGDFVGGAIAPGLTMEASALHNLTAKLPLVDIAPPLSALATSTQEGLRSGIFLGYVGLVEGLIGRLRSEMHEPDAKVIATGGQAGLLARYCPSIYKVDPFLPLLGLRILYELNTGPEVSDEFV